MSTPKQKSTFLTKHQAELSAARPERGYKFPAKALRDIHEVVQYREAGGSVTLTALARVLKREYQIPLSIGQLSKRILIHLQRESW